MTCLDIPPLPQPPSPPAAPDSEPSRSGQPARGIDSTALVSGAGHYTGDLALPGQTFIAFQRSPHAHALIVSIDLAPALACEGVLAVYTCTSLKAAGVAPLPTVQGLQRADGSPAASATRYALAWERVRHVGEAVLAVVADSALHARDAADAATVRYEPLPSVIDPVPAMRAGAPALCDAAPDNISAEMQHGDVEATTRAFAAAAHRIELELVNQRVSPCTLEPRSVMAVFDASRKHLTVHASTQMPTALRDTLAELLPGLSTAQVRVQVGDVGGGFGMKTVTYPEDIVTAFASMSLQRPVKWQAERSEEFNSALHGRDLTSRAELALDANGRVLALRVLGVANVGAYATGMGVAIPLAVGPCVATSVYDIGTLDLRFVAVMTHTAPTGAYRGAGQPEVIHIIERLMDAAARALMLDPAELRRRNMIRPEQMPYPSAMGQTYDSGRFAELMDKALQRADWNGFALRREASARRGRLRGRGLATFLKWTGAYQMAETIGIAIRANGLIEIISRAQEMGQGIATSCAQLAVDVFDVPIGCVRVLQGDTDRASGFGSGGSRSLFTGGSAVHVAAERAVDEGKRLAAQALEVSVVDVKYRAGRFEVVGTDLGIGLFELAALQAGSCIEVEAGSVAGGPSWPNGCHICEVEVDAETGAVEVVSYVSVNDIGRVINPAIARGQIEGAVVQGIGQALSEQIVYDAASGQLLSGSFLDYAVPRAASLCQFETDFDTSIPCLTNVLGAKGAGELGAIGATPAVANAVVDALAHAGLGRAAERIRMPMTSERVWRALNELESSTQNADGMGALPR